MLKYATIVVSVDKKCDMSIGDRESLNLHATREDAIDTIRSDLRSGDKAVALLCVEDVFRLKSIEMESVLDSQTVPQSK